MTAGMALRGDRIHRYVTAFCPLCHDAAPERPLVDVVRLSATLMERDGRIWLENRAGGGAVVRFTLPVGGAMALQAPPLANA